jgi:hypothetical protein
MLVLLSSLAGCSSSRKSNSELRGLMMLDITQLGRNRSYYSKRDAKRIENNHKKFHQKIKKKSFRKKR